VFMDGLGLFYWIVHRIPDAGLSQAGYQGRGRDG